MNYRDRAKDEELEEGAPLGVLDEEEEGTKKPCEPSPAGPSSTRQLISQARALPQALAPRALPCR